MKILILAGGQGTRLWPLSRKQKPKQFQKLISGKTMLQETVNRLNSKFPLKDIFISTNEQYVKEIKKEFPKLSRKNIISEPVSRERVAAIALFLVKLKKEDFHQPILVLPSDHLIKNKEKFQKAISIAEKFIKKNSKYIVVLGAQPNFPDTGLGYIKAGKVLEKVNGFQIRNVDFFKEKPNLKRTRAYLKSKDYLWNTAIYLFTPAFIEQQIKSFVPDSYKHYQNIKNALAKGDYKKAIQREYYNMDKVSLEYTILENSPKIAVIPVNLGWSDVGSWAVLKNCLCTPNKNYIKGNYIGIESKNVMVYGSSDKLIAGVGIKDLIIVMADDIILICHRDESQKVKDVIKKLEKQKKFNYI